MEKVPRHSLITGMALSGFEVKHCMEVQDHNLLANATFVLPGQSAENLIQTCETYISFVESSKMPSPSDFGLAGLPWPP